MDVDTKNMGDKMTYQIHENTGGVGRYLANFGGFTSKNVRVMSGRDLPKLYKNRKAAERKLEKLLANGFTNIEIVEVRG